MINDIQNTFNDNSNIKVKDKIEITGAYLQFSASLEQKFGKALNYLINLTNQPFWLDFWRDIQVDIKDLTGDYTLIWEKECIKTLTNFIADVSKFSQKLMQSDYDSAKKYYGNLIKNSDNLEDLFKIDGSHLKSSFTVLYVSVVNIKIATFIEFYRAKDLLKLDNNEVNEIKYKLKTLVEKAKSYLSFVEEDIQNYNAPNIINYFQVNCYYYKNVIFYLKMWSANIEDYLSYNGIVVKDFRIPIIAAGTLYKLVNLNTPAQMTYKEVLLNTFGPSSNASINASIPLYNGPGKIPSGQLSKFTYATTQNSLNVTIPCGLELTYTDGHNVQMGLLKSNYLFPKVKVTSETVELNNIKLQDISIDYSDRFVHHVKLTTRDKQYIDWASAPYSSVNTVKANNYTLYSLDTFYVPSHWAGIKMGIEHIITGLSAGGIYDNLYAKTFIKQELDNHK